MLKYFIALFCIICVAQAADKLQIFGKTEEKQTCHPTCGDDECCVSFYPPVLSRRQLNIDTSQFLPNHNYPTHFGKMYICQKIKKTGDKCLTRNTGEWCDCSEGLSCEPRGTKGLDAFFGTCS